MHKIIRPKGYCCYFNSKMDIKCHDNYVQSVKYVISSRISKEFDFIIYMHEIIFLDRELGLIIFPGLYFFTFTYIHFHFHSMACTLEELTLNSFAISYICSEFITSVTVMYQSSVHSSTLEHLASKKV